MIAAAMFAMRDKHDTNANSQHKPSGRNTTRTTPTQYTPLSGQGYFSEALQVETTPGCVFRVYYTPPQHDSPVFVFHQGAGYAGLSFACLAKELRRLSGGRVGTLAFDARAHGGLVWVLMLPSLLIYRYRQDKYKRG